MFEDSGSNVRKTSALLNDPLGFSEITGSFFFQMNGRCLGFNGRHKLGPVSPVFPPAISCYVAGSYSSTHVQDHSPGDQS